GCTIAFSLARCASSEKTIAAKAVRFSDPSGSSTSSPKVSLIAPSPGVPGSTTWRASLSASMTTAPRAASFAATADFPEATAPVSPTCNMSPPYKLKGMNTNDSAATRYTTLTSDSIHELEIKRSRFITYLFRVETEAAARAHIAALRKTHFDARHHC